MCVKREKGEGTNEIKERQGGIRRTSKYAVRLTFRNLVISIASSSNGNFIKQDGELLSYPAF
jgi:hypothetical protein